MIVNIVILFAVEVHPFEGKIKSVLQETNTSSELFSQWQVEVQKDFVENNYMYVPETDIQEDIRVDARNVVSYLHKYEINTNMAM